MAEHLTCRACGRRGDEGRRVVVPIPGIEALCEECLQFGLKEANVQKLAERDVPVMVLSGAVALATHHAQALQGQFDRYMSHSSVEDRRRVLRNSPELLQLLGEITS